MSELQINLKAIHLVRLSDDELPDLLGFDCADDEMNSFLCNEAFNEQEIGMNNTVLLYYMGTLAAFCSICCDSIPLSKKERDDQEIPRYKVPAIKVARLGRDVRFKGCSFGKFLIDYIKNTAFEISTTKVGVRFLTLDAYLHRVGYYESLGFIRNEAMRVNPHNNTVSMRADIYE